MTELLLIVAVLSNSMAIFALLYHIHKQQKESNSMTNKLCDRIQAPSFETFKHAETVQMKVEKKKDEKAVEKQYIL